MCLMHNIETDITVIFLDFADFSIVFISLNVHTCIIQPHKLFAIEWMFSKPASTFVNEQINEIVFIKQIITNNYYNQVYNKPVHPC